MAEAFNVELREVDVRALFAASDKNLALARRMETELHLSKPKPTSPDSIVEGPLLAKLKRAPFYVFFHLDHTKGDFFLHLQAYRKPTQPEPKPLVERRAKGGTAEKLFSSLAKMTGGPLITITEVTAEVSGWRPPVGTYAPLVKDGAVLSHVGAEFVASRPGLGLRELRWKQRPEDSIKVWLSFAEQTDLKYPEGLWHWGVEKCTRYLKQIA